VPEPITSTDTRDDPEHEALLADAVGIAPQIASMWMTDESHARRVIDEFNERGVASLDPEYRGGRPRRITCEQRRQAVAATGASPDMQGVALTRWSLPRLADHLAEFGLLEIGAALTSGLGGFGRAAERR
jgi:Homeodomain-like domain